MKKIIIIILSTLIFLGLVGFIVIKYTYHTINYFSKTVESSFNLSLKNVKNKAEDFKLKYSDFKCSGKRSIECSAEKILLDKENDIYNKINNPLNDYINIEVPKLVKEGLGNWDTYVEGLNAFDLQTVCDLYQKYVDEARGVK